MGLPAFWHETPEQACLPLLACAGVAAQPLIHAAYESAGVPWEVRLLLPSLVQSVAGMEPALQPLLLLHLACIIFRTLQPQEASKAGERPGEGQPGGSSSPLAEAPPSDRPPACYALPLGDLQPWQRG